MSKKSWRSAASFLMVVLLLLVSCGPKAAPTPAPTVAPTAPTVTPTTPTVTPTTPIVTPTTPTEKPKYGGTINMLRPAIRETWDSNASTTCGGEVMKNVYEQLTYFDWDKGLAGSGEIDWGLFAQSYETFGPELAESWKTPTIDTFVLQIRRGVHWALNPASEASRLMNGRELTAEDVAWNLRRTTNDPDYPQTSTRNGQPGMARATVVQQTGPWEVTAKFPVDPWTGFFWVITGGCANHIYPPEVVKKYGNTLDWRNVVGTGPYMVTDAVAGNVVTYTRNPNYWKKETVGPGKGDQLPYADTLKLLIVPDTSTRLAAMRTGRADWITDVELEDGRSLLQTNPKLLYKKFLPGGLGVSFRIEKTDLPFKDVRVRQALMMATDFEAMKNDLYRGEAEILVHPIPPSYPWLHIPMKDLPESVQVLYKYNPERAKQLLAEAGYPNGFKTKMVVENRSAAMDPASVFKAMWAKVGVDVELQPRDFAVYTAASTARSWDEMYFASTGIAVAITSLFTFGGVYPPERLRWSDPVINKFAVELQSNVFINMSKANEIYRKAVPYIMEQAYIIPRPTPYTYTIWQPWIKNYRGEIFSGTGGIINLWPQHAWVDRDLKEQMTGRR